MQILIRIAFLKLMLHILIANWKGRVLTYSIRLYLKRLLTSLILMVDLTLVEKAQASLNESRNKLLLVRKLIAGKRSVRYY